MSNLELLNLLIDTKATQIVDKKLTEKYKKYKLSICSGKVVIRKPSIVDFPILSLEELTYERKKLINEKAKEITLNIGKKLGVN